MATELERERERELARLGVAGASGSDVGRNALAGENRDCKERRFLDMTGVADGESGRSATKGGNASATAEKCDGVFLEECVVKRESWGRRRVVRVVCRHHT